MSQTQPRRLTGISSLVMLRRINFYTLCFAFFLSVLLILAGSRYTDNTPESQRTFRSYLKTDDREDDYLPTTNNPYSGAPDIEKILERTRSKIKTELLEYNFTYSGVNKLEDLVMETGGLPLRSIIISTWRSGTTFLGEILNSVPGNFYHYEPLLKYDVIQIRGPPHAEKAMGTIKDMLRCNFNNMEDYFDYGKTHMYQFNHNTRLWDHCKIKKELCFDGNFTSRFCKLFPFQSMKVVRVRLKLVQKILEDKELKAKVVLLIRDPRGVMQSRQHRDFCQPAPDCWRPELLCADMISDYVAAARLLKEFPDKLLSCPFSTVNEARKHLFTKIDRQLENIPPTKAALYQHFLRAVFQDVHVWGQMSSTQILPDLSNWGWTKDGDSWQPTWTDLPVAAEACMEMIRVLRYEELALNPNDTAHLLLKWLNISPLPAVNAFLNTHTNVNSGGVSSTYRVSREVPFRWKSVLKFDDVENIQTACKEAMRLWGYEVAHNATHMASKQFNPLQNYTIEV